MDNRKKKCNNTINSGLRLVDHHGDRLKTYIAVETGGRDTKVYFVVKFI